MKICLVTSFPPSQGGLSEYGLHVAEELRSNPFLSLTILADKIAPIQPELDGYSVERCWSFDDPSSALRILLAIARLKPDVVWFNLLFSTFGRNPLNAFLGLLTPLLARLSGRYTHVTLHHLMDTVDLKDAGIRHPRAYRWAGSIATRILLLSNSVSVLMPGYRKILKDKYGRDNVHLRSHGVLTRRPEYPEFSRRGNPEHRILAFGKWGTYKRLELMIEAFGIVAGTLPNTKLVIGGGDHPQAEGYVDSVKNKYASPEIEFTGYVHEDQLPHLFQKTSVAVMPYSSSTGCSGVAHLACAYGVPIVCSDLQDFRQMAEGEDLAIEFYQPGNARDLAACLIRLLTDPGKQQAMAVQNFSTGLRMTMPTIVQKYLRHFELEQRAETLRQVTRFRRLPGWVPSKALMLRLMTRNSRGWVRRSALRHPPKNSSSRKHLGNDNIHGGGKISGIGVPVNGNGVVGGGVYSRALGSSTATPARGGDYSDAGNGDQGEGTNSAPASGATKSEGGNSQREQRAGIDGDQIAPQGQARAGDGGGRNSQGGAGGGSARSDGTGRERATQCAGDATTGKRDSAVKGSGLRLGDDGEAS
jgi:glycosyltransferase involved in cell wall biosynthesis